MKKSFICPICKSPFTDQKNYRYERKYCGPECRTKSFIVPVQERFEKYIIPEPNTGCWLWCGSCDDHGYGHMRIKGRTIRVHRVSWELYVSPIPDGLNVLHKCDTPPCANPTHLFLGTLRDNSLDRDHKGRGRAIFTDEEVRTIRCDNRSQYIIAEEYDISRSAIQLIKTRKTYCRVD